MYKFHIAEVDPGITFDTSCKEYAHQGFGVLDSIRDIPCLQRAQKKLGLHQHAARK